MINMITDERIAAYIGSLDKELPKKLKEIERNALEEYVPIIKKPTQGMLRFLMKSKQPLKILEVGTAVGFSAILMAEYMPKNAVITTIEKMPKRIEKARKNILYAEKEKQITLLEGDAADRLKELVEKKEVFDFIFMDAAKGQYLNFLPDILLLLKKEGLLVSDNVLQDGDIVESRYAVIRRNRTIHARMRAYLYELTHHEMLETMVFPIGDGITLSTKCNE